MYLVLYALCFAASRGWERMKEIVFYTLGYVIGVLSMLGAEYIARKERDKRNDG